MVDGCNHAFCLSCLRDWIRYKPEQPVCPLCKRAIAGYTHGYGKLSRSAAKRPKVQGAGSLEEPYELLDDDDAAGPSEPSPSTGEFCVEHTVVRPQPRPPPAVGPQSIEMAILSLHHFLMGEELDAVMGIGRMGPAIPFNTLMAQMMVNNPDIGPHPRRSRSSRPAQQRQSSTTPSRRSQRTAERSAGPSARRGRGRN